MINFEVITEKENKPLKRRDIYIIIDHPGSPTPKKEEIAKALAEKYNTNPENVEMWLFTEKGKPRTKVKSYIWEEKRIKKQDKKETEKGENSQEEQT